MPRAIWAVFAACVSSVFTAQMCYLVMYAREDRGPAGKHLFDHAPLVVSNEYAVDLPRFSQLQLIDAVTTTASPSGPSPSQSTMHAGASGCCDCKLTPETDWQVLPLSWNKAPPALAPLRPKGLPIIYVVTATKARLARKADLTRVANTLRQVPALHWIVVEDAHEPSALVAGILERSGMAGSYSHVSHKSPPIAPDTPWWKVPRGLFQRNFGATFLRTLLPKDADPESLGVLYYADDDNVYDLRIFEQMRYAKHVAAWPVGLVGNLMYEGPVADPASGRVVDWHAAYNLNRKYPIDMAGFALSVKTVLALTDREEVFSVAQNRQHHGQQESDLLKKLVNSWDDIEPMADMCRSILVWHTKTLNPSTPAERWVPSDPTVET